MDLKTIFTKTAKGVTQVNQKTQSLSRDLMKVLKVIDGKSNVETLATKADVAVPVVEKALVALKKDGFIKVFEVKQEVPLTDFGGDDDFDFTAPGKLAQKVDFNATQGFKPSQYRTPASADQVERATAPAPSFAPAPPQDPQLEAALAAAREKAQTEARARAEREAQIRARLEIEAKAKRDAEQRANEEMRRAQVAAENARIELESKLAEEKKQRQAFSDTRDRLTREQLEKEAQQQQLLSAARAKAEAEAAALAQARVKAEAEAKALAEARVQAEAAAKRQQQELEAAQRDLRHQLKEEIEAKIRAEMAEKLAVEVEEGGRAEVEAAVYEEAREEARQLLEQRLNEERASLNRATEDARKTAEDAAKRMLAEQEIRIRAEMETQIAAIAAEKAKVEIEARKAAEEQAAMAAKAAAEMAARLKAEETARKAAEEESEARRKAEAQNRVRMEARAREEAEARAKTDAEMQAKLAAEKEAKVQAQARALIEAEMREKSDRENQALIEIERQAREEAEQKAQAEVRAREIASRVAAEQAEARQRVELEAEARLADERREAEERLNVERAARERAEEKSRAEEEAEARQRAAQVARLKELAEQQERDLAAGIDPDAARKPKRYGKKKSVSPLKMISIGLVVLLIAGLALVHVIPLGAVNSRFEKALAEWIHDDVTSSGLRISLLPSPHVKLDQVALGKLLDAKALSGKLYMDISTLFGDRFVIDTIELSGVTVSADALQRAVKWANSEARGKGIVIGKIALRTAKVEVAGMNIDEFDADLKFDKNGKLAGASVRAKGGKWTIDAAPDKPAAEGAAAGWSVDFSARGLDLPIGAPVPIGNLTAKGMLVGDTLEFPQVEAKLLEGTANGSVRVDWKQGISVSSEFTADKIKVGQLTEVFTRDVALGGRLEGQFTLAASAPTVGALLDAPAVQGVFVVKEGAVGNVDLVQVMRSPGSVGGQSKFAELAGQLRVSEGQIRYEKLKLSGGVLLANGNVSVGIKDSVLSGTVNSEIRSTVAQDRGTFNVSGKVARPALKRGG